MNDEIMVTGEVIEEAIEMTEEYAPARSGKGGLILTGIGLAALGGTALYKFVIKPLVKKHKAKKEQEKHEVKKLIGDDIGADNVEETEE